MAEKEKNKEAKHEVNLKEYSLNEVLNILSIKPRDKFVIQKVFKKNSSPKVLAEWVSQINQKCQGLDLKIVE